MAKTYVETQPRSDAYTGILIVSLVTLLIGCLLLFLDYNQYSGASPTTVNVPTLRPSEGGGPKTPASGPAGGAPAGGAAKDAK